jgi:threonine dehydrogenase-like Zn-dependent dehydrogenase
MQAIVFRYSLPRFALATVLGALSPRAYAGPVAPTSLRDVPEPALPAADWAIVRTALCGICGSDTKQIYLNGAFDNPLTSLISFPHILGHEVVGVIEAVGPGVTTRRVGERVVVNPWLSCAPRGIQPPCLACQQGQVTLCEHFSAGRLAPGIHLGNCRTAGGGYAPRLAAHESQLIPIPDAVSFEQAVLADPFAVSLHAVLKAPPAPGSTVLVYGSGTLGLLAIAILHVLFPTTRILAIARYPHQEQMARRLGAHEIIRTREAAQIIETVAALTGAPILRPRQGKPWLRQGVDIVYDMVGSPESVEVGVRMTNPRGCIVISGVARPARFEWTPLYFKELRLIGSNAFGVEEWDGVRQHAMAFYLQWAAEGRFDLTPMITQRFRLPQYQEAFVTAQRKSAHQAIKVVFDLASV